jgi:hypothetical protein
MYTVRKTGDSVRANARFTPQSIAAAAAAAGRRVTASSQLSANPILNDKGEVNAQGTLDLIRNLGLMAQAASMGMVDSVREDEGAQDHREAIAAAIADKSGQGWLTLGEIVGNQVVETMGRAGFTRRLLQFNAVPKGGIAKVRVRHRDVVAYVSTTDPNVVASQVRQPVVYPAFFNIIANILIEDSEINLDDGDLLEDRYQDGLEQLLVAEDRAFKNIVDVAAQAYNPLFLFPSLTPSVWTNMKVAVEEYGNTPVTSALMSMDLWPDVETDPEFISWFSDIEKHEIAFEGTLGKVNGVEIITDGIRHPKLKVLDRGQLYMFSAPQTLGVVSQLGDLNVQSINLYPQGQPKRGWYMAQQEALAVVNPHAVVRGQKS